jgi:hypothetical protein
MTKNENKRKNNHNLAIRGARRGMTKMRIKNLLNLPNLRETKQKELK